MINVKVLDTLYGKYSRWSQLLVFIYAIIYIHALIMIFLLDDLNYSFVQ